MSTTQRLLISTVGPGARLACRAAPFLVPSRLAGHSCRLDAAFRPAAPIPHCQIVKSSRAAFPDGIHPPVEVAERGRDYHSLRCALRNTLILL